MVLPSFSGIASSLKAAWRKWHPKNPPALSLGTVLAEEMRQIHGVDLGPDPNPADPDAFLKLYYDKARELPPIAALCLSGGGIRSASFALGVLQSLARHDLLRKFHYLSTVSGGGYIGSWLSAWRLQASGSSADGLETVLRQLKPIRDFPYDEIPEIKNLRRNSNYMTPKLGLMSADTWTVVILYLRNLLLNWLVLLPFFMAVLLFPRLAFDFTMWVDGFEFDDRHPALVSGAFAALGGLFLLFGLSQAVSTRHKAAYPRVADARKLDRRHFLLSVLLPIYLTASPLTLAAVRMQTFDPPLWEGHTAGLIQDGGICGAAFYLLAWLIAWMLEGTTRPRLGSPFSTQQDQVPPTQELVFWTLSGGVAGMLVAWGFDLCARMANPTMPVVFGVSWLMVSLLLADMLYVGLASYSNQGDVDREWLARASGWLLAAAVVWAVLAAIVLYAEPVRREAKAAIGALVVAVLTGGSTAAGGFSVKTVGTFGRAILGKTPKTRLLTLGTLIFLLALAFLLSGLNESFLRFLPKLLGKSPDMLAGAIQTILGSLGAESRDSISAYEVARELLAIAILAAASGLASFFVNINRFSLHAVYRNRLTRAFLGAARSRTQGVNLERKPDPFTGFDQSDNPPMADLWRIGLPAEERRLFPVVNMALNLAGGRELAWQERKAESFVVTPLHSGANSVGFRRTWEYGGSFKGVSLGTAMAISGAAVSPNMGYHSSPLIGMVMMLFNVRLGWWLGNPRSRNPKITQADGPRLGLGVFLREFFDRTDDQARYIYLSDGGHFDNLGIYEMVRRRARFILVSDAGCDPGYAFDDLGNAVRKIWIDLGVRIEFDKLTLRPRTTPPEEGSYCAIGRIVYPEDRDSPGTLIYVKPGFHGTEQPDIRSYATAHPDFPHESTGDQMFSESQLEAYRALGAYVIERICQGGQKDNLPDPASLEEFEANIRNYLSDRATQTDFESRALRLAPMIKRAWTSSPVRMKK